MTIQSLLQDYLNTKPERDVITTLEFFTPYHVLKVKEDALEKTKEKLNKVKDLRERHMRTLNWIEKKMKQQLASIRGAEHELSVIILAKKIFDLDYYKHQLEVSIPEELLFEVLSKNLPPDKRDDFIKFLEDEEDEEEQESSQPAEATA